jgi:phospholipase/carboxylesterase
MNDSATSVLETVEHETGPSPEWSVLWLHGLGADGHDFAPIVPELVRKDWPALRFVFPHAPVRAVTINNGVRMRAWYDIRDMNLANRADEAGVDESVVQTEALIAREAARGIPAQRVLLAGFSQGGAIALATALRRMQPLAGVIALSTYLPMAERLAKEATATAHAQPLFMAHGQFDPVVPYAGGDLSARKLRALGFNVDWHAYPMAHQVCAEEIRDLGDWMGRRFAAADAAG